MQPIRFGREADGHMVGEQPLQDLEQSRRVLELPPELRFLPREGA
jgi:hypothetical protein